MNDQERAAIQQALEALESWRDAFPYGWMSYTKQINDRQALEALRAALAQQPEPACERVMTITTVPITVPRVLTDADLDAIRKIVREGGKE